MPRSTALLSESGGLNESGGSKTVALSPHCEVCTTIGREQSTTPLRKAEGALAVALPGATKKCGRGLPLEFEQVGRVMDGSAGHVTWHRG